MKPWALNIVLLASIVSILCVYEYKKSHTSVHLDYLNNSFEGLRKILPESSRVHLKTIGMDPVNYWETIILARYLLAPRAVGSFQPRNSILYLYRLDADSTSHYLDPNKEIVWEYKDSVYHYTLAQ